MPLSSGVPFSNNGPMISMTKNATRIHHTELIGTISGSQNFTVQRTIQLNPGLATSFPWLSTQAQSWEQYRFSSLNVHYISRSAATAAGSIMLVPDYDVLDAPPSSEIIAMSYKDARDENVWRSFAIRLDQRAMFPTGNRKYVRLGLVSNADLKTYDVAALNVCTIGTIDNTTSIGKIYLEYTVEFFVPQVNTPAMNPKNVTIYNLPADQGLTDGQIEIARLSQAVTNPHGIVYNNGEYFLPAGVWFVRAELSVNGASTPSLLSARLERNGSSLNPPVFSYSSSVAGDSPFLGISGHLISSGVDTCRIRVNYSASVGSLFLIANACRIYFSLA